MSNPKPQTTQIFAVESRNSLSTLLASKAKYQKHSVKKEKKITKIDQPDEPISFAQLMVRDGSDALEDELQSSLMAAVSGGQSNQEKQNPLSSRLNKAQNQFTGACNYSYLLRFYSSLVSPIPSMLKRTCMSTNTTSSWMFSLLIRLQIRYRFFSRFWPFYGWFFFSPLHWNLLLLATLNSLKNQRHWHSLHMTLRTSKLQSRYECFHFDDIMTFDKVTSTENAIIFGNIVYDITGSQSDRNCVVLNDIKIDIMDYIQPAFCSDQVGFNFLFTFLQNF